MPVDLEIAYSATEMTLSEAGEMNALHGKREYQSLGLCTSRNEHQRISDQCAVPSSGNDSALYICPAQAFRLADRKPSRDLLRPKLPINTILYRRSLLQMSRLELLLQAEAIELTIVGA